MIHRKNKTFICSREKTRLKTTLKSLPLDLSIDGLSIIGIDGTAKNQLSLSYAYNLINDDHNVIYITDSECHNEQLRGFKFKNKASLLDVKFYNHGNIKAIGRTISNEEGTLLGVYPLEISHEKDPDFAYRSLEMMLTSVANEYRNKDCNQKKLTIFIKNITSNVIPSSLIRLIEELKDHGIGFVIVSNCIVSADPLFEIFKSTIFFNVCDDLSYSSEKHPILQQPWFDKKIERDLRNQSCDTFAFYNQGKLEQGYKFSYY